MMWKSPISSLLICAISPALVVSCAVTPPQEINEKYREIIEQRRNQYEIKEGDQLTVSLYKSTSEDLKSQTVSVLPDGRGDPFLMPNYRFAGKSLPEVEEDVQVLMKDEAGPNVRVSISLVPREEIVYLTGQFERAQSIPLLVGMTLHDAIATAGGVRITADSDYVILRRPFGNPPGRPEWFRIDVNDVSEEIFLLPRDQIEIELNALATVVAYLREYIFGIIPGQLYSGLLLGGAI